MYAGAGVRETTGLSILLVYNCLQVSLNTASNKVNLTDRSTRCSGGLFGRLLGSYRQSESFVFYFIYLVQFLCSIAIRRSAADLQLNKNTNLCRP